MSDQTFRVPHELIARQLDAVFRAWDMADEVRDATVEIMVETDLAGIDSHGIAMLPLYALLKSQGKIVVRPEMALVADTPATALIDGGASLGHAPAKRAMGMAIEKAKSVGVGAVAVRNSNHFGAAGAFNDGAVFFFHLNPLGLAKLIERYAFQLETQIFADELAASQNGDVAQHGFAAVAETRRFDGTNAKSLHLINYEKGQCFAFHVFGNNQ